MQARSIPLSVLAIPEATGTLLGKTGSPLSVENFVGFAHHLCESSSPLPGIRESYSAAALYSDSNHFVQDRHVASEAMSCIPPGSHSQRLHHSGVLDSVHPAPLSGGIILQSVGMGQCCWAGILPSFMLLLYILVSTAAFSNHLSISLWDAHHFCSCFSKLQKSEKYSVLFSPIPY